MGGRRKTPHATLAALLDHLARGPDSQVEEHVATCARCAAEADRARRLLAAGRRAAAAPMPPQRVLRKALLAFRGARRADAPSYLALVLDSLLRPAPALRAAGAQTSRFLRYEGDLVVEIEVTPGTGGTELRGQLTPPDYADEVTLVCGRVTRRAAVGPEGTFVLRRVPRRAVEMRIGKSRITGLEL